MLRRTTQICTLIVLGSLLSGCLLTRVYEFKNQFCNYQQNFELQIGEEIALIMHNPVLLDKDVIWLMGASPSYRDQDTDQLDLVYVIEKDLLTPDPQYEIPLRLRFKVDQGDFRLSAGIIESKLGTLLTPDLIDEIVAHTCDSATSILQRTATVDLSDLDPLEIPRRSEIEKALGDPTEYFENGKIVEYQYRLKNASVNTEKSVARIWYDEMNEQAKRIRFHYLRYEFDVDFQTGVAVISIDL